MEKFYLKTSPSVIFYSEWKRCQRNYAFDDNRKYEVLNHFTSHIDIHQNSIQKSLDLKF